MRKVVFALAIAALFFYLGQRDTSPYLRNLAPDLTATHWFKKFGKENSPTHASNSAADTSPIQSQKSLEEKLLTQQDSELFETLYSKDFAQNWKAQLPTLVKRIFQPLPAATKDNQDDYDKEIIARLGILKSFTHITDAQNDEQLKTFLFGYLEYARYQPWPLRREALHTLHAQNDLSQEETQKSLTYTDAQSRNTASFTDKELVHRVLEGER